MKAKLPLRLHVVWGLIHLVTIALAPLVIYLIFNYIIPVGDLLRPLIGRLTLIIIIVTAQAIVLGGITNVFLKTVTGRSMGIMWLLLHVGIFLLIAFLQIYAVFFSGESTILLGQLIVLIAIPAFGFLLARLHRRFLKSPFLTSSGEEVFLIDLAALSFVYGLLFQIVNPMSFIILFLN